MVWGLVTPCCDWEDWACRWRCVGQHGIKCALLKVELHTIWVKLLLRQLLPAVRRVEKLKKKEKETLSFVVELQHVHACHSKVM